MPDLVIPTALPCHFCMWTHSSFALFCYHLAHAFLPFMPWVLPPACTPHFRLPTLPTHPCLPLPFVLWRLPSCHYTPMLPCVVATQHLCLPGHFFLPPAGPQPLPYLGPAQVPVDLPATPPVLPATTLPVRTPAAGTFPPLSACLPALYRLPATTLPVVLTCLSTLQHALCHTYTTATLPLPALPTPYGIGCGWT